MTSTYYKNSTVAQSLKNKKLYFLFDFDGTLSPIVKDPEMAFLGKKTELLLKKLQEKYPIGIISGRSLNDLYKRLSFKVNFISGTHGLESPFTSLLEIKKHNRFFILLQKNLEFEFPEFNFEKKKIGFSIHYRQIKITRANLTKLKHRLSEIPDIKTIYGKKVINILPNRPHSKGWVVEKLLKKMPKRRFFYIGDDITDEDVFRIHNPRLISFRVGKSQLSNAQYFLKSQKEINTFIKFVLTEISNG